MMVVMIHGSIWNAQNKRPNVKSETRDESTNGLIAQNVWRNPIVMMITVLRMRWWLRSIELIRSEDQNKRKGWQGWPAETTQQKHLSRKMTALNLHNFSFHSVGRLSQFALNKAEFSFFGAPIFRSTQTLLAYLHRGLRFKGISSFTSI